MKRIISLGLIMVMALSFTACGTKSNEDTNATEAPAAQETTSGDATAEPVAQGGSLIVGTEAGFAPYEYLANNEVVGVDMDIAKAIADAMGKKLEIQNMDFDGALIAVQQGKVDMVAAGVSVNEERKEVMDFSKEYVNSTEVIVVNKETKRVTSTDDLNDKIIAVQQGNIADLYVSNKENVEAKEVKRYSTFLQASEDLKNDKVDCIVMDLYPAQELVKGNDALEILQDKDAPAVLFEDKYAIAVKKGNTELLSQINTVLDQLIAEGKIEEFYANHTTK